MCLVLMGRAASGKDAILNILVKDYGFKPIISYTTRPMRDGEIDGITYHYISNDEFKEKIEKGFFFEWKSYEVDGAMWYYGRSKEDMNTVDDKNILILTPNGVRDMEKLGVDMTVIYLYSTQSTIIKRLKKRNDSNDNMEERIKRDYKDFKDAEFLANKIVYNNYDTPIREVVNKVIMYYKGVINER